MKAILILAAVMLAGCGSVEQKQDILHKSFERYRKAIADGEVVARRREFFVPSMSEHLDGDLENDLFEITVGHYIHKESSHYETFAQRRGCLTLNGHKEDGTPVTLFLEYQKNETSWLISGSYVYIQLKEDFSEKALCPEEARQEIERAIEKRMRMRMHE
jgi:hypothetical protein